MPEQFKQFDFSKEKDQKKFGKLDKDERKEIAQASEDEAYKINHKINSDVDTVEEKNLTQKEEYEEIKKNLSDVLFCYGYDDNFKDDILKITKGDIISSDVLQIAQRAILFQLYEGSINKVIKINEVFSIDIFSQEVIEKFPEETQSRVNKILEIKISTAEEAEEEINKREDNVLNFLHYCTMKLAEKNIDNEDVKWKDIRKYIEKYQEKEKIGFGEMVILRRLCFVKENILSLLVNKNKREAITREVKGKFESGSGETYSANFPRQIIHRNPDIIFLCARSAVAWGVMYKEFSKNLKNKLIKDGDIDTAIKIPSPEFKVADFKLRFVEDKSKEDRDALYQRAINRYVEKLEPIKQKIKSGALKEPVKIAVFDESGETGSTKKNQILVIQEAAKKLEINALVIGFDKVTSGPDIVSPLAYIDNKITRRGLRGKEILDNFKNKNQFQMEECLSYAALYKINEKTVYQILKTAGKQSTMDKKFVDNFLNELKEYNNKKNSKEFR